MSYLFKKTDIVIVSKTRNNDTDLTSTNELYFYKDVLSDNSDYFRAMFSHEMKEKRENKIVLDDKIEDLAELLKLIHPIQKTIVNTNNVFMLLKIAHKYSFNNVIDQCLVIFNSIHDTFSKVEDILSELVYVHQCIKEYSNEEELCNKFKEIIKLPIDKLINSTTFDLKDEMLKDLSPEIMMNIICKMYEKNKANNLAIQTYSKSHTCLMSINQNYVKPYTYNSSSYGNIPNAIKAHIDSHGVVCN